MKKTKTTMMEEDGRKKKKEKARATKITNEKRRNKNGTYEDVCRTYRGISH